MRTDRVGSLRIDGAVDVDGRPCRIAIANGMVGGSLENSVRIDGGGSTVVPGFVDLQVNGAVGIDLTSEPERLWEVASALPRFGVTRFLPTIVTSPPEVVARARAVLLAGPPGGWIGAVPLGLHLEGPMLSPHVAGAHARRWLRDPSAVDITEWTGDHGLAMVTLAPELPGALAAIRRITDAGVVVAIGHTAADTPTTVTAVDAGARCVTHLFNAMAPLHHRDPGPAGLALGGDVPAATLIADGVHLHPAVLAAAWRALHAGSRILVSDAVAALGSTRGRYRLGDRTVEWDGSQVRDGDGRLAGSGHGLDHAVRTVMAATGTTLGDAVYAASTAPADLLGRGDLGRLSPGAVGDVVLLDAGQRVLATVVGGVLAYCEGDRLL